VLRGFVEGTTLSYRVIAARTGVSIGTIARHVRRRGWIRPETGFTEEHYSPEGRSRMRRQALAERLLALAEDQVDRAAMDPHGSPHALRKAAQFLKALEKIEDAGARK
jgi:IS30 family transposase